MHTIRPVEMGDSRKYPYPTTGGMSILTPLCPRKFQNPHPPMHALPIPKSLTPPPLWNFPFFFRPFGIPVRLPKTSNERGNLHFFLLQNNSVHNFRPDNHATQVCQR